MNLPILMASYLDACFAPEAPVRELPPLPHQGANVIRKFPSGFVAATAPAITPWSRKHEVA